MRTWFKILGWIAAVVGAVLAVLYVFFFDVWTVPIDDPMLSASIEPTLSAGDLVVVTRRTEVSRGDLLRCPDPQAPGRFIIGRAIGKFGDQLDISAEFVAIDSRRTPSPRGCPSMVIHDPQSAEDQTLACSVEEFSEMTYQALRSVDHPEPPTRATVEPGKWYLVSDDRHVHVDSRDFGQIVTSGCQHIVFRIVGATGFGDRSRRLTIIW
jgi:signal peptidase I